MAVKEILQLGHPGLHRVSEEIQADEMHTIRPVVADMHDTVMDFRLKHGFGRAMAAPQIGLLKRLVYMYIDQPMVFINPVLTDLSDDTITLWDNCMSFPQLLVKVTRHRGCTLRYRDLNWKEKTLRLDGDLSELLQHECDHLDGILATQRAIDSKSFALRGHENQDHD